MGSSIRVVIASSVLASTFFVGGCVTEPLDEPDTTAPGPEAVARTAPTHSVSGGGRIDYPENNEFGVPPGYSETYGFSARQRPDGTVDGNIEMHWDPPFDFKVHGDIACLNVVDNGAVIGMVVTRTDNPGFPEGLELLVAVVDNGSGHNAPPDQISGFFGGPPDFCQGLSVGDFGGLYAWTHGNVTVR